MDVRFHYDPDGEAHVNRKQAAALMGVNIRTIATWEVRGRLKRIAGCPPRRPLYRFRDVVEAEKATRDAAVRTSGTEARAVRHFDENAA